MTASAESTVDTARIEFLDRLTPRQAVLLHYFWLTLVDALCGDTAAFQNHLAICDRYVTSMKLEARDQVDLMVARVSGLAHQLTDSDRAQLGISVRDNPGCEIKCIRCGCSEARACMGGCYWWSTTPPVCSRCA